MPFNTNNTNRNMNLYVSKDKTQSNHINKKCFNVISPNREGFNINLIIKFLIIVKVINFQINFTYTK